VSDLKAESTLDKTDSGDDDVVHLVDIGVDPDLTFCGLRIGGDVEPADSPWADICVTCGAIDLLRKSST
jgi:hypothetical protein